MCVEEIEQEGGRESSLFYWIRLLAAIQQPLEKACT
jgi:hypothetical protein